MKFFSALLILILCSVFLHSQIVINELLYDPIGSDNGYEWIELYNPSTENINLFGWRIEKAGTNFETCFTFDFNIILHSGDYLLIGEQNVESADIVASLGFQNGGSATDGVRLVSDTGKYTDTILYDSPNTNNLVDDSQNIATDFAPDVSQGHSLARLINGSDTDSSADWFDCDLPTPKSSNIPPLDLSVSNFYYSLSSGSLGLFTVIQNLSTVDVDNYVATIEFYMNQEVILHKSIPVITSGDSIVISKEISPISAGYHIFKSVVILPQDNNLENNEQTISALVGQSPVIINELMIKPQNDDNEWVEVFKRFDVDNVVDNLIIEDRSGGKIKIKAPISDYFVICKNKELFMESFSEADTSKVRESEIWTSLNNTTEILYLKDDYGTILDTLFYNAYHLSENISYERVNPYTDNNIQWKECKNSSGATPTKPNSNLPFNSNLTIEFLKIEENSNMIKHFLKIYNSGLTPINSSEINCYVKRNDEAYNQVYSKEISLFDTLYFYFETEKPHNGYFTFKYNISDDDNPADNIDYGFYNDDTLPFVINEIMYAPFSEEPEWIEISNNYQITEADSFYLKVADDLYYLPMPNRKYFLITSNFDDAEFLAEKYNLDNLPLIGLSSLSNNGKQLTLYDKNFNLIESFFYEPDWNNKEKGKSIERINPFLPADYTNFGPCLNYSTPQAKNSLYVQILPAENKFEITPNPFSPYKSEHTIIQYKLNRSINRLNIKIYDLKGREVRRIAKNSLSASSGSVIWDGKDNSNKILPIGIYIVNLEAIGTSDNRLYKKAKTVVIKK